MKEVEALDPFDSGYPHLWLKAEHLGRYLFVADSLVGQSMGTLVIDVATGTGYGARELAAAGATVVAVDRADQIERAQRTAWPGAAPGSYPGAGANKRRQGALPTPARGTEINWLSVDLDHEDMTEAIRGAGLGQAALVTCFETLEHVQDPERLLHMTRASMALGGTLCLSVPMANQEPTHKDGTPKNPFHRHLFTRECVDRMLAQAGFTVAALYGQSLCNTLFRREMNLLSGTGRTPTEFYEGTPEVVYHYARLVGYPSRERLDESYALLWIAETAR